ncbi:MAG: NAD-dependent epimerase/dehydratase family protein [Chitinophagaceae bacterium]
MQTILGSTGIIGTELAKSLTAYTNEIRLVSRNPQKVNPADTLVPADLLNAGQTADAIKGSDIVYLAAGLPYHYKVWQQQWPVVMQNVIAACKTHHARLVFFDNIYMYGPVKGIMTEETPFGATSRKGKVRAAIANLLLNEMKAGTLQGMICRAPEFYGPGKTLSGVNAMVFDNLRKGKPLQWLVDDQVKRTYIYTPDAARATACLGNDPSAWMQTWHLPCPDEYMNGKKFIELVSEIAGKQLRYKVLGKFLVKIGGLFNPLAREMQELLYQYDQDYNFSSDKFKKAFPDFKITSYREGITAIIKEING